MVRQFEDAKAALGDRRSDAPSGRGAGRVRVAAFDVADSFLDTAPQLDFTIGSVHVYRR